MKVLAIVLAVAMSVSVAFAGETKIAAKSVQAQTTSVKKVVKAKKLKKTVKKVEAPVPVKVEVKK
jgi:hypothetical protein